jgi:hypothetical protein
MADDDAKKDGKKKKKKSKAERAAEEAIKAAEQVAEAKRKAAEDEAARLALEEQIDLAKQRMKRAMEREGLLRDDDSILGPFETWTMYEGTRAALARGVRAGVEAQCYEFERLRKRLGEEKEALRKLEAETEVQLAEFEATPVPGAHNSTVTVSGSLLDDAEALTSLWQEAGGEDGNWVRATGWELVEEWGEKVSKWKPPSQDLLRPAVPRKERGKLPPLAKIVAAAVPPCEGVVLLQGRVQNVSLFANGLEGILPDNLGLLSHLKILNLHKNALSGEIPESLTRCALLQHLDLSQNDLSETLPAGLADLQYLKRLHLERNKFSGPLPPSMSRLLLLQEFTAHHNRLQGPLPVDLGECRKLRVLSLHHNRFTGPVPESLTQCTRLEQLLLVKNRLQPDGLPRGLYSALSALPVTPRSGIKLNCQVYPSKGLGSDSEAEEERAEIIATKGKPRQREPWRIPLYSELDDEGRGRSRGGRAPTPNAYANGATGSAAGGALVAADNGNERAVELYSENQGTMEPWQEDVNAWEEEPALESNEEGGYYDDYGNWIETEAIVPAETATTSEEGGYYDDYGNWVESWVDPEAAIPVSAGQYSEAGYYDDYGNWVDGAESAALEAAASSDEAYYDEASALVYGSTQEASEVGAAEVGAYGEETVGYYDDATGEWVEGYYDAEGNWVGAAPNYTSDIYDQYTTDY